MGNLIKSKIKLFFKDELVFHTTLVFIGTSVGGFFNLLYHLISVRLLSSSDYGTFNTLISLIMFVSVVFSPLGATLTRFFTEYITREDFFLLKLVFKEFIIGLSVVGLVVFILSLIFSSFWAQFLNTLPLYITICGGVIGLSLFSPLIVSLLQSLQKFGLLSFVSILSSFAKLAVGTLLMFMGGKILGGLSGFLVSPILLIIAGFFIAKNIFKKIKIREKEITQVSLSAIYKYFFPVSLAMFSFTLLTNIDVILVKHFFTSLETGYYSVAQMIGKIILFLPSALAIVIFPKSTRAYVENKHSYLFLYKSLMLAGVCCLGTTFLCFLFPETILKILTSKSPSASKELVGLFSLTMSFYALVWIIINFLLATHNLKFILPLVVVSLLESISIYFYHPTLKSVIQILLFFSMITFLMLFFLSVRRK